MNVNGIELLATVEQVVDLLRIEIHSQQVPLLKDKKPTHGNIMVTCPVHAGGQEKHPSCGISTHAVRRGNKVIPEGTVHCFTCGYTVDLGELVSNCFGYNDKGWFGYKWLMKNFSQIVDASGNRKIVLPFDEIDELVDEEIGETIIHEEELDKYRYTHPYMYERKLTDKVINYFDVGFDKDKGALTFPVHDSEGIVRLIQRRSVKGRYFINDEGGSKGDYLYGLYQVLRNLHQIDELYICESPIDALTCWTHRVFAVATMGASVTERQIDLLNKLPIRNFISGYDNDEAGRKGEKKLAKGLRGKMLFDLVFPKNVNDINAMTEEQFTNRKINLYY